MRRLLQIYHLLEFCFYKSFCGMACYLFLLEVSIPVFSKAYDLKLYNFFSLALWIFILLFCCFTFFLKKAFFHNSFYSLLNKRFLSIKNFKRIRRYRSKLPDSGEFLCALLISTSLDILPSVFLVQANAL